VFLRNAVKLFIDRSLLGNAAETVDRANFTGGTTRGRNSTPCARARFSFRRCLKLLAQSFDQFSRPANGKLSAPRDLARERAVCGELSMQAAREGRGRGRGGKARQGKARQGKAREGCWIIYPVPLSLSLSLFQIAERDLFIPDPEADGKHGS